MHTTTTRPAVKELETTFKTALRIAERFTCSRKFTKWYDERHDKDHPLEKAARVANAMFSGTQHEDKAKTLQGQFLAQIKGMLLKLRKARYKHVVPHIATEIEIGAILSSTWGYGQTNVDFYVVVEMTEKSVRVCDLASDYDANGDMTGTVYAKLSNDGIIHANESQLYRVKDYGHGPTIQPHSFACAKLWNGRKAYTSSHH